MNRKEAAELSPFIKAFSEGRIIEYSSITDVSKAWREVKDFPIEMINNFKFRIKPEPKYRPFANAEECWAEMQKHQPFGWVINKNTGRKYCITAIHETSNEVFISDDTWKDFYKIKKNYTFIDGTPFGVKVEE